mgnify:CR=1 FL=1
MHKRSSRVILPPPVIYLLFLALAWGVEVLYDVVMGYAGE